jgi:ribonuclease Z
LTSFLHFQRSEPLKIIGPYGIKKYVESSLQASSAYLLFELKIEEYDPSIVQVVHQTDRLKISTIPLVHKLPTMGYKFEFSFPVLNIRKEFVNQYHFTIDEIKKLKNNEKVNKDGKNFDPAEVCYPRESSRSYVYMSDTGYKPDIVNLINGVDLLYHETTYLKDMEKEALERLHSTTHQAAKIAKAAQVKKMIIGHYSSRYKYIDSFERECREIFEESYAANDGSIFQF